MAPLSRLSVTCRPATSSVAMALALFSLAACATTPEVTPPAPPVQTVAPSPLPEPPAGGATIAPPDLSGNEIDCAAVDGPCEYGDDPYLDELWDACGTGDGTACDRLYFDSAFESRYEQFGNTCGDRSMLIPCPDELP